MKKVLLLIYVLCLSSSVFSQQKTPPRVNYYYYEADAGPRNFFRISLGVQAYVYLLDNDNFQKYKDGKVLCRAGGPTDCFAYEFGGLAQAYPLDVPLSKKQQWYLVIDRNGQKFPSGTVLLYSEKELPAKP